MFRFFRSIRQQLLNEGKTVRYLKYAVGEVLLVVIGILIALSVNNWNEGRKLEQQRVKLIENLKVDFQANSERLEICLADERTIYDGIVGFLKTATLGSKDASINEIKSLAVYGFKGAITFEPALGSYQTARSTGTINLIDDPSLNELFLEFESNIRRYLSYREIGRQDHLLSGMTELRKKLGSFEVLFENAEVETNEAIHMPDAYRLSDQEYRDLIAHKETYAAFANKSEIRRRTIVNLAHLNQISEHILTALEALD